jgi:uncharacterized protein YndB with AHSA1/START domain
MKEEGFLVIADITGYTSYLSGSELEHAQDSLRTLLQLLIQHTQPPLTISRLEGDAVISYASKGSFIQAQSLIERLENTYVAFRQTQQRMRLNTTCTCMACKNIPNLDLKFMVHYGEFMLQDLGQYTELIGNDVNLIHRLLKNQISEQTKLKAYAAFTQPAIDALTVPEFKDTLLTHTEMDPHEGEISLRIQDLLPVWERERERQRIRVDDDDCLFSIEEDFPISPALLWDYLTSPEHRAILSMADDMSLDGQQDGRTATGSAYICAHGDHNIRHAIVDWRPFEYYTYESDGMVPGTKSLVTMNLVPILNGTRVVGVCGRSMGDQNASVENDKVMIHNVPDIARAGCQALYERVMSDLELGIIIQPKPNQVAVDHIESGIQQQLVNPEK